MGDQAARLGGSKGLRGSAGIFLCQRTGGSHFFLQGAAGQSRCRSSGMAHLHHSRQLSGPTGRSEAGIANNGRLPEAVAADFLCQHTLSSDAARPGFLSAQQCRQTHVIIRSKLALGIAPKCQLRRRRACATTVLPPLAKRASTLLGVASPARNRRTPSRSLV
jgi:hypothetical protein